MIIYKILNLINGKCYIGQTVKTFNQRYWGKLKWWGNRNNPLLERAAKKYGLRNFLVEILEENVESVEKLNELEQYYIEKFNCLCPNGYNFKRGGENKKHHALTKRKIGDARARDWIFKNHHTGEIVKIHNLKKFCRENNLNNVMMLRVSTGYYKKHKGWSRPETILKSWKIKSPSGEIFIILEGELRPFCRKYGLNKYCIDEICKGTWSQHKGWTKV